MKCKLYLNSQLSSSTPLKTFNNYTMIMTNNSGKIIMLWVWCFCLCCLYFWVKQKSALVNFMLFLNIFKILKISFWTFWRKNCISVALRALFSWKPCIAFRIAQCKQPQLVKPCLNSDPSQSLLETEKPFPQRL